VANEQLQEQILERKEAEAEARLASAELSQIFQTAADGMRVIDKDFNVLRINETFSRLSGRSEAEVVGKKCYEVFPGPLCNTPECPMVRVLGGEERVVCEVEKERSDGTKIPCIVTATPFRGPGGELIGIVDDIRDITDRKYAEEQREKLIVELQEALGKVRTLSGLLPICASCKKIRDDNGYWNQLEAYIGEHSQAEFTHSMCPECVRVFYGDLYAVEQRYE
jgi:PAS domain S-box-containing protein